jgi:hypothetical protein
MGEYTMGRIERPYIWNGAQKHSTNSKQTISLKEELFLEACTKDNEIRVLEKTGSWSEGEEKNRKNQNVYVN